jgi:hypothetical protein
MGTTKRRQAGEGGISEYQTKAGRRFLIKYPVLQEGGTKRVVFKRGFTTRREAAAALRAEIRRTETGEWVNPSKQPVGAYLAEWLDDQRRRRNAPCEVNGKQPPGSPRCSTAEGGARPAKHQSGITRPSWAQNDIIPAPDLQEHRGEAVSEGGHATYAHDYGRPESTRSELRLDVTGQGRRRRVEHGCDRVPRAVGRQARLVRGLGSTRCPSGDSQHCPQRLADIASRRSTTSRWESVRAASRSGTTPPRGNSRMTDDVGCPAPDSECPSKPTEGAR